MENAARWAPGTGSRETRRDRPRAVEPHLPKRSSSRSRAFMATEGTGAASAECSQVAHAECQRPRANGRQQCDIENETDCGGCECPKKERGRGERSHAQPTHNDGCGAQPARRSCEGVELGEQRDEHHERRAGECDCEPVETEQPCAHPS